MVFAGAVMRFDRLMREVAKRAGYRGAAGRVARSASVWSRRRSRRADLVTPRRVGRRARLRPRGAQPHQRARARAHRAARLPHRAQALGGRRSGPPRLRERGRRGLHRLPRGPRPPRPRRRRPLRLAGARRPARRPARWGDTPVFLYGFDDLTRLQQDAIETLARVAGAEVTVSLTHEPGRRAFAARARTVEDLRPLATEVVELPAPDRALRAPRRARCSPPGARALRGRPRRRSRPGRGCGCWRRAASGPRPSWPPRRSCELLRSGVPADEIAVVVRSRTQAGAAARPGLRELRDPDGAEWSVPVAHTALGRGVLALLRCALPGGDADDVLAYLRTPGYLRSPALADTLEFEARRAGAVGVDDVARAAGRTSRTGRSTRSTRVRAAAGAEQRAPLLTLLSDEARPPLRAPAPRRGARRSTATSWSTRACSRALRARAHRADRARRDRHRGVPAPAELHDLLGDARRRSSATRSAPGRGADHQPDPDPRAALPRGPRARPPGGRVPRAARAGARSCPTRSARGHRGLGPAPRAARGQPRRRALPLLRLRLAPRGDADPLRQHLATRRAGRPSRRSSSTTSGGSSPSRARGARAPARPQVTWPPGRGADRGRARPRPRRGGAAVPRPSASSRCASRRRSPPLAEQPAAVGGRASRPGRPARCAGWSSSACAPSAWSPTPGPARPRLAVAPRARGDAAPPARGDGLGAGHAETLARARGARRRGDRGPAARVMLSPHEPTTPRRALAPGARDLPLPLPRGEALALDWEPVHLELTFGAARAPTCRRSSWAAASCWCAARSTASTSTPSGPLRDRARLQGLEGAPPSRAGSRTGCSRSPLYMLAVEQLLDLQVGRRLYQPLRGEPAPARAAARRGARRAVPAGRRRRTTTTAASPRRSGPSSTAWRRRRSASPASCAPACCAAARHLPLARRRRLLAPGDLPERGRRDRAHRRAARGRRGPRGAAAGRRRRRAAARRA